MNMVKIDVWVCSGNAWLQWNKITLVCGLQQDECIWNFLLELKNKKGIEKYFSFISVRWSVCQFSCKNKWFVKIKWDDCFMNKVYWPCFIKTFWWNYVLKDREKKGSFPVVGKRVWDPHCVGVVTGDHSLIFHQCFVWFLALSTFLCVTFLCTRPTDELFNYLCGLGILKRSSTLEKPGVGELKK